MGYPNKEPLNRRFIFGGEGAGDGGEFLVEEKFPVKARGDNQKGFPSLF